MSKSSNAFTAGDFQKVLFHSFIRRSSWQTGALLTGAPPNLGSSGLWSEVALSPARGERPHLSGLVVRRAEAFDGDLSEDVRLQRLLGQVAVVDDGWVKKSQGSHAGVWDSGNGIDCTKFGSFNHY